VGSDVGKNKREEKKKQKDSSGEEII